MNRWRDDLISTVQEFKWIVKILETLAAKQDQDVSMHQKVLVKRLSVITEEITDEIYEVMVEGKSVRVSE